jgi:hypothetical protein
MVDGNVRADRLRRGADGSNAGRREQRGSGRLKAIVYLAILGSFVFVCVKVVPILVNEYQFEDSMKTAARFASVNRAVPDDIRKTLIQEAAKDNVPIKPEDIQVTAESGNVRIEANYSVTVDLRVYQWTLNFHPSANNNAL